VEEGLDCSNGFAGTYFPDTERINERKPITVEIIKSVQHICKNQDDDLRWLVALLRDSGMRLGEAVGLLKSDIKLDAEIPHLSLKPHQWRTLKTKGSLIAAFLLLEHPCGLVSVLWRAITILNLHFLDTPTPPTAMLIQQVRL
jgi:integrase